MKTRDLDGGVTNWRCKADEDRVLHLFVCRKSKENKGKKQFHDANAVCCIQSRWVS